MLVRLNECPKLCHLAARMVYSYASKGGRKYPYYVCRSAQQKGWATCPSKSLPAHAIEESVVGRIREQQIERIASGQPWEQMDRVCQIEAIRKIVERVSYDGRVRRISIRFHEAADATMASGQELR
jgi:Recombinase zinc beta ribbon domain